MKILVANLGSTSFKYRLFDMADERQLARGGIERIGSPESRCVVEIGGRRHEPTLHVPDHAEAVRQCLAQLTDPESRLPEGRRAKCRPSASRRCTAGGISGVQRVTPEVLAAMEEMNDVAPAHNPPYIAAMRLLAREAAGDSAGGGLRDRLPPHDPRRATATTPCPTSGPRRRWSSAGASTAPATATSPRGRPSCSAATTCGSSPATWAARARCARSATARAWPPAWA